MLESMFKQIGVSAFPNVTIGDGYAHMAFSSEDRAVIIQPYLGKHNLNEQCRQLRNLRKRLQESEPDSQIMPALYFTSDATCAKRIKDIAFITPSRLTSLRHFLTSETKEEL